MELNSEARRLCLGSQLCCLWVLLDLSVTQSLLGNMGANNSAHLIWVGDG